METTGSSFCSFIKSRLSTKPSKQSEQKATLASWGLPCDLPDSFSASPPFPPDKKAFLLPKGIREIQDLLSLSTDDTQTLVVLATALLKSLRENGE